MRSAECTFWKLGLDWNWFVLFRIRIYNVKICIAWAENSKSGGLRDGVHRRYWYKILLEWDCQVEREYQWRYSSRDESLDHLIITTLDWSVFTFSYARNYPKRWLMWRTLEINAWISVDHQDLIIKYTIIHLLIFWFKVLLLVKISF